MNFKITEYTIKYVDGDISSQAHVNENGLINIDEGYYVDKCYFSYSESPIFTFQNYDIGVVIDVTNHIDDVKTFVLNNPLNSEYITNNQKHYGNSTLYGFKFDFEYIKDGYTIKSQAVLDNNFLLINDSNVYKDNVKVGNFAYGNYLYFDCSDNNFTEILSIVQDVITQILEFREVNAFTPEEDVPIEPDNRMLSEEIDAKIESIKLYDSSPSVNLFYYNNIPMWLDKATRVGLMNSISIEIEQGKETTTLWLDDLQVTIPCDKALEMLKEIEMYALECYNVTAMHIHNVKQLTNPEEVRRYHPTGYPEKLKFSTDG